MSCVVHTRWLDATDYASVVVIETDEIIAVPLELDRHRALQLLARASRQRRRTLPLPLDGQLALLHVA